MCCVVALLALTLTAPAQAYPWPHSAAAETLADRFAPPPGFTRLPMPEGTFGAWLRGLPLRPAHRAVQLFDGTLKANQNVHVAVVDLDTGTRDLQQCADAVMRMRAEWLWASGRADEICFRFVSGDAASWKRHRTGFRAKVDGAKVSWSQSAAPSADRKTFRRYLDLVFSFASSLSLAKEVMPIEAARRVEPGDFFIHPGAPGHAMLVVDVVENNAGERRFLLAQSYMPAQDFHVVHGPTPDSPWYTAVDQGPLRTPEWTFDHRELRRFAGSCATADQ